MTRELPQRGQLVSPAVIIPLGNAGTEEVTACIVAQVANELYQLVIQEEGHCACHSVTCGDSIWQTTHHCGKCCVCATGDNTIWILRVSTFQSVFMRRVAAQCFVREFSALICFCFGQPNFHRGIQVNAVFQYFLVLLLKRYFVFGMP